MKKNTLALATALALGSVLSVAHANEAAQSSVVQVTPKAITYPTTQKVNVVDDYFGTKVSDPYRWLEDDLSPETAEWVKAQNAVTFDYLSKIPYREQIEERITKLMDYEKQSQPFKEGKFTYFYKNDGLQNQDVLYRQLGDGEAEIFLDPNTFSEDGTTSLAGVSFSRDGSLVAYSISEGGSDWRKVIVLDTETKKPVGETLVDIKFSGISWLGNQGFYYSSYDKPQGSELSAKTDQHKLYFHKLGTKQSEDQLIFGGFEEEKYRYVGGYTSDDERYLFISASVSTSGNKLFFKDLSKPNSPLKTILDNTSSDTWVIDNQGTKLYLVTNLNAPNKRVVTVDASQPQPKNWKDLIPETKNVLRVSTAGGNLFASYIVDAISMVKQYDMNGKLIREIKLPDIGSAYGFSGKKDETEVYYSFTNYKMPSTTYRLNIKDGDSEVYYKSKAPFDPALYDSRQVFYTSKDGTKVPMIITYKKGTPMDGSAPTILYGYGGFNISLTPSFNPTRAAWLELGGVYAVANIRGGGEYGKEWHNAGIQMQKQNVFDDFIAAAEFLIDEKVTSSNKLAINGGSNGGLLVGAVMTQRPELFKVALPAVGVLDMLRYHTFTAGAGWAYDYGTAEQSKEMFQYLKGYSPVHNVKAGVEYPATLITTGDHDDRVVPAHSYKFAAELQSKQAGSNPTLIRIETNAGHGAGTPTRKIIETNADIYSFALFNMGIEKLQ
ncbi:S9 family peptidase [Vibrio parahaemolyticus]|uniref:prolyl oligopeptidase family serine peptidase n=1 Tax=Vibrio parahaemolyticus TaxID=670 RepID=UPI001A1AAB88|nr:prolyl oligopeptidase family serine peptidase [Vibrio parahaemolyticus]EGQ7870719.1 S9 family peptidase [Vibrio parahaemolyticus]EJC1448748.1 S9 family peptidase [Vibrio parahaemolyticus]EJC1450198.1 S9 family peptidase [Vibrio parahaemolyticus]